MRAMMNLYGEEGNDQLAGNDGTDTLVGGIGVNILEGGKGADVLVGGAGHDTYNFSLGDGQDTITDTARAGEGNVIQFFSGITLESLTFIQDSIQQTLTIQVAQAGTPFGCSASIRTGSTMWWPPWPLPAGRRWRWPISCRCRRASSKGRMRAM